MKKYGIRVLLLAAFVALSFGMSGCESAGTSTVYVGVHGGYGYGPGWGGYGGYGGVHRPIGPYW